MRAHQRIFQGEAGRMLWMILPALVLVLCLLFIGYILQGFSRRSEQRQIVHDVQRRHSANPSSLLVDVESVAPTKVVQKLPSDLRQHFYEMSFVSFEESVSEDDFADLQKMPDIKGLKFLNCNDVSDDELAYLSDLQTLDTLFLESLAISDDGLVHLAGLVKLQKLSLILCSNVSGAGFVHLEGMGNLRELQLGNTALNDAGLSNLKRLEELETLSIYGTSVSDNGMPHLSSLKKLKHLELDATSITDAGLSHLEELKNLETLFISRTDVTSNGVAALKQAIPNVDIYVD